MYKLIKFDKEGNYIKDFLALPKELYSKSDIVQNEKEERDILLENHLLSKYFKIYKLLVYKEMKVAARCILTIYPNDQCAYIGFFECIKDTECSKLLFEEASRLSRDNKCNKIIGPVDCSFWIKYRLKFDNFNKKPYVSEPYNKEYYLEQFLAGGYRVVETYVSNYYDKLPRFNYTNKKCKDRYDEFISKGYEISSPKVKDYDIVIRKIYKLLIELFKDFPVFKTIKEEDFVQLFASYQRILDFSFVKLAYYKGEAVGFVIGMPDYGNMLYGKIGLLKYGKILFKKTRSSNYVVLYMGVSPEHVGLGNAMGHTLIKNVQRKRATSIGALIKAGKVTQRYVNNKITSSNTYVLLEYDLGSH